MNFIFVKQSYNSKLFKFLFLIFLFLFFNIIVINFLTNKKLDLTKDNLYTVSANTKSIIKNLNEPISIKLFFSNSLSKELAQVRDYEKRVRELLVSYEKISNNNINIEIIDPKPFTDQEDLANVYGIQGLQLNEEGEKFYFGAVFSNSVDDTTIIPFFELDREQFLEYDLTKTIYNLANTTKPNVGLISGLPLVGRVNNFQGQAQYEEPFYIYQTLNEFFNVVDLTLEVTTIPDNIDQLLIIHPKNLNDETLYAIDQFVMSGKGVTFFIDPFSEFDNNLSKPEEEKDFSSSNLSKIFTSWGFDVKPGMIAGDIVNGRKVSLGNANNQKIVTYVLWLAIQENLLSKKDIVTANLDYVFLKSAGSIENLKTNNSLLIEPLVSTSEDAMLIERYKMQFRADPEQLLKEFQSENKNYILGARIKGKFNSAFTLEDLKKINIDVNDHINKIEKANIILYADTDLLSDNTWISKQDMFGRNSITAIADNGRMVVNSIESMSGGKNLIGLRGRGTSNRPFLVIEDLQKKAELSFREKQMSLQNELQITEDKLKKIQENNTNSAVSKTSEQNIAIEDFQNKIFSIRKQLREVQRQLNADIDQLESNIKLINIWLMPFIVIILYYIIKYIAEKKRREFYKKIGRIEN
ncbi:MAG: hypothetical protein CMJ06_03275 [Pelagibacterales bacterium]|nr:hypothetical protein [Pelagibacterales bacterium]OUU62711.1 MAG: hypothetical protein CBC22_03520 [Alphaproteobacteria bacterium TMED62]|tara:strand:- start:11782 stop:13695 length:1914 start_codon:yes stop_codon:yes gene_type:complete